MKYNHTVKQDGQVYEAGQEVPDMGSVKCVRADGNTRDYEFLAADLDKLPKYDSLFSGTAYCIDTVDIYKYDSTNKTWIKQ